MSDLYTGQYGGSLYKRKKGGGLYDQSGNSGLYDVKRKGGMTESDLETLPYLINERQKQSAQSSWLSPLDLAFKLLGMPNSVIANAVQDIGENKPIEKVLEGALKSATLQRTGSWKTTFFGGKDEGEDYEGKGLFPGQAWAKGKIPVLGDVPLLKNMVGTWEDAIGLIGDIFLDPTTYMTFGLSKGATAANKAAAKMATKETMKRVIFNRGNLDEIAKITRKGFDTGTFQKLTERSMKLGQEYLEKYAGKQAIARLNNKIYKETHKRMLQTPGADFVKDFTKGIVEGGDEYLERASAALAKQGPQGAQAAIKDLKRLNPGADQYLDQIMDAVAKSDIPEDQLKQLYRGLIEHGTHNKMIGQGAIGEALDRAGEFSREFARISDPQWAKNFAKMGERKVADLFGLELGKGVRAPSKYTQTIERMKGAIGRSRVGKFAQAVMAKLDDGIVGDLKRAFNIRNPYQEMLNADRMANHYTANDLVNLHVGSVRDVLEKYDDAQLAKVRDLFDYAKKKEIANPLTLLDDPNFIKNIGEKEAGELKNLATSVKTLSDDWAIIEKQLADKGLLAEYTPIANYLPHRTQVMGKRRATKELGPLRPGFTKHQNMTLADIGRQDAEVMKFFLGTDDVTTKKIVGELNWSTVNMDLREMFMYRAYAHARAVANADLVEKFTQFGIKPEYITQIDSIKAGLERSGEMGIPGLRQVQSEIPAIKGMFFDSDVADIIDRVIPVTSSDKGLRWWDRVVNYVTGTFKNWATFSPGFHLRNFRSNLFTGFVNYGAQMLNPNRIRKSIALSAYGIYGKEQAMKYLGKLGYTETGMNKILAETIAGKSAAQWVDEVATKSGIVSKASRGYNLDEFIEKTTKGESVWKKANPFGKEFVGLKASKEVGGVIESSARLEGFFIDLEKMAGKGGEAVTSMVDAAVANTKKFFFDYEDLSDFEKKVMKKIVPFYCVPDDAEILTVDGFKKREQIKIGETVLAYDIEKNVCEWQPLKGISVFNFDGDLLRAKGCWADFRFTEDHRWPVEVSKTTVKGKRYGGNRKIIRAHELNTVHQLILSAPYAGEQSVLSERDAKILAWIVTDGYFRWRKNHLEMMIYQSPKKHAQAIRELLGEDCTSESIHPGTSVICFRIGTGYTGRIKKIFKSKDDFPQIVTRLSSEVLEAVYQVMMDAEGYYGYKGTTREFTQFGQVRGPVLDAFQIVCQLLDKPFGYMERPKAGKNFCGGYVKKVNRLYVKDLKIGKVAYKGKIWCPQTPAGTWVMRQNGKVILTGNSWIRKNVALQVNTLIEKTGTMAAVAKVSKSAKDERIDEDELPDYLKGAGAIPFDLSPEGIAKVFMPDLPYKDLNQLPFKFDMSSGIPVPKVQYEDAYNNLLSMAHPIFKTVLATAGRGWDPFMRRDLDAKAPAPRAFRVLSNNPQVFAALDGIMRAAGFDKGLGFEVNENGKLVMDGQVAKILEDNFLLLKRLDDLGDTVMTIFPQLDDELEKLTGIKGRYEDMDRVMKTMSFALGISNKAIDLDKQEEYRFRDALRKAEDEKKKDRERTPGSQRRSDAYYKSYERRIKRLRAASGG